MHGQELRYPHIADCSVVPCETGWIFFTPCVALRYLRWVAKMSCTRWIGSASTSCLFLLLVLSAIRRLLRQVVCLVSGPEGRGVSGAFNARSDHNPGWNTWTEATFMASSIAKERRFLASWCFGSAGALLKLWRPGLDLMHIFLAECSQRSGVHCSVPLRQPWMSTPSMCWCRHRSFWGTYMASASCTETFLDCAEFWNAPRNVVILVVARVPYWR